MDVERVKGKSWHSIIPRLSRTPGGARGTFIPPYDHQTRLAWLRKMIWRPESRVPADTTLVRVAQKLGALRLLTSLSWSWVSAEPAYSNVQRPSSRSPMHQSGQAWTSQSASRSARQDVFLVTRAAYMRTFWIFNQTRRRFTLLPLPFVHF